MEGANKPLRIQFYIFSAPKSSASDKLPRLLLICGRTEEKLKNAIYNVSNEGKTSTLSSIFLQ